MKIRAATSSLSLASVIAALFWQSPAQAANQWVGMRYPMGRLVHQWPHRSGSLYVRYIEPAALAFSRPNPRPFQLGRQNNLGCLTRKL